MSSPTSNFSNKSYDSTVRDDIELFRSQAQQFTSGKLTADEFRPFRLRRGIYSQRQHGVQMIRTKIPGRPPHRGPDAADGAGRRRVCGRQGSPHHSPEHAVSFRAAAGCADAAAPARRCSADHSRGLLQHCAQRHGVPSGGRSCRTSPSTCSPTRGELAFAFLHKELTDSLPRKFKVAFSGCPEDCMATPINDVGLRADRFAMACNGLPHGVGGGWVRCRSKPAAPRVYSRRGRCHGASKP